MVAATLRTILAQPDLAAAKDTVERICRLFEKRYPKLVEVLREAETDVLAYYDCCQPFRATYATCRSDCFRAAGMNP